MIKSTVSLNDTLQCRAMFIMLMAKPKKIGKIHITYYFTYERFDSAESLSGDNYGTTESAHSGRNRDAHGRLI